MNYFGIIARFYDGKGYGFIAPDEGEPDETGRVPDIFMHATELVEGDEEQLQPGARVCYMVASSHKGPKAVKVRLLAGDEVEATPQPLVGALHDEVYALVDKHVQALVDELGQLLGGW